MIRKYLIFGKQVFLSSTRRELQLEQEVHSPIEIKMPVEVLWKCNDILKDAEYLQSVNEDQNKIRDRYKVLLKLVTPYAVLEKDRIWLLEQDS